MWNLENNKGEVFSEGVEKIKSDQEGMRQPPLSPTWLASVGKPLLPLDLEEQQEEGFYQNYSCCYPTALQPWWENAATITWQGQSQG